MKRLLLTYSVFFLTALSAFPQQQNAVTNEQLLKLYEGLRVADISDGMDMVGIPDIGLLDTEISPLWKDIDNFSHQFVGIAFTVRYVPTYQQPMLGDVSREEYKQWRDQWYTNLSGEPFIEDIKEGHVVVIDNAKDGDTGSVGSNNSLIWKKQGAVGIVSAGGIRDTDEIIKQKIPVYTNYLQRGRGIRPGRNELESYNEPIVVGGVYIRPGDVVVADGDGVIVVPREQALVVADAAREEKNIDMEGRRQLYEDLGIPIDFTVGDKD